MGSRPTVLVIDDDADNREGLQHQLEALGVDVVLAADGVQGLRQLQRWNPMAVLCDLTMPGMGGLEFAVQMRRDPRYRAVLLMAVTGRTSQSDLMDARRVGFDGHLLKPVTPEMLEEDVVRRLTRPTASRLDGDA